MPQAFMPSPHRGKSVMQMIVKQHLAPPDSAGINYDVVPQSLGEGQKNFALQKFRHFYQGLKVQRMVLPKDTEHSQALRQFEWNRQASMPWGNHFMITPTDAQRLNNPGQTALVKQKQLAPPSSYGQFYAFMHALSAAFGTIKSSS